MKTSYVDSTEGSLKPRRANPSKTLKSVLSIALAAVFGLLTVGLGGVTGSNSLANAEPFGIACGGPTDSAGYAMSPMAPTTSWFMVEPDAADRKWTLQEAFSTSMMFVNYHGEGDAAGQLGVKAVGNDRIKEAGYAAIKSRVTAERTIETCFGDFTVATASFFLTVPKIVSSFSGMVAGYAFNPSFICGGVESTNCVDLVGIVGGHQGADGGIIGTLTSSIYLPLSVLLVALGAISMIKTGLMDRKFREAFTSLGWIVGSFLVGMVFLFNPAMIARGPMLISSNLASCVIGSFSGENCMAGQTSASNIEAPATTNQVCSSSAGGSARSMSFIVNSLNCNIWKAFVLEPYSVGSFGMSYESLDVNHGNPNVLKAIKASGIDPKAFCVNLVSSKSATEMNLQTLELDGSSKQECNLAAYQIYLQSDAVSGTDVAPSLNSYDARWNKLITVLAQDDGLWRSWANNNPGDMVTVSVIATVAGSILIMFVSIIALAYYIGGVLLMAFAPLFMLFGIQPGRGKKMMLGWLEMVVSGILKYVASALFLIVSINILGTILGSVQNPWLSLILVLVVTCALFMYRKEIMDLIGTANMGGQKLTSKLSSTIGGRALQKGGKLTTGAVGGAVGSKLAGGTLAAGAKAAISRDLKRGTGFGANVVRQMDRTFQGSAEEARETVSDMAGEQRTAERELQVLSGSRKGYEKQLASAQGWSDTATDSFQTASSKFTGLAPLRAQGIETMKTSVFDPAAGIPQVAGPLMAEMLKVSDRLKDLQSKEKVYQLRGVKDTDQRMVDLRVMVTGATATKEDLGNRLRDTKVDGQAVPRMAQKSDAVLVQSAEKIFDSTAPGVAISQKLNGGTYSKAFDTKLQTKENAFSADAKVKEVALSLDLLDKAIESKQAIVNSLESSGKELEEMIENISVEKKVVKAERIEEVKEAHKAAEEDAEIDLIFDKEAIIDRYDAEIEEAAKQEIPAFAKHRPIPGQPRQAVPAPAKPIDPWSVVEDETT